MDDEQDMRKMGALRKFMPVTAATFIVGWLAISGVPPFAGFWSKDEILLFALVDSPALYVIGLVTAVLTAFYMTRQVIMVFFGEAKWESYANADEAPEGEEEFASTAHGEFKPHESPPIMLFPLVVLAGLALVGGIIQLPSFGLIPSAARHRLEDFLHPVVEFAEAEITETSIYDAKALLALLAIVCALLGIARRRSRSTPSTRRSRSSPRSWPTAGATTGRSPRSWAAPVARRSRRSPGSTARHRRRRQRCRQRRRQECRCRSARSETGNVRNYAGIIGIGVVLLLAWFVIGRGVL